MQDYYSDNEELLAKLAAGATGYDVLVPTGNAVETLIAGGSLAPLDKAKLPNLRNIKPAFLDPWYDAGNQYSVPYAYSVTLIGYNVEKMKELGLPTDTWAVIFDPTYLERVKGKAKRVAGSVFGDEELKREGELHERKADAVKDAARLDDEAAQERAGAEITARERELAAEEQRLVAEESAELREARLEREWRESEARVEREHAQREMAVERQAQAQEATVDADEARAAAARAERLRSATRIEKEADKARATAEVLDSATDRTGK